MKDKYAMVLAGLSLSLIVIGVYGKSVNYEYTYLDDHILLAEQLEFLSEPKAWAEAFRRDVFNDGSAKRFYRPLMTWTLIIDAQGKNDILRRAHISNLIYHLAAIWLVYLTLRELKTDRKWAFLGALMMAVHPLLTQAVVWIPGRNDSLLAIFWLASFICFVRYINNRRQAYLTGHWTLLLAGLMTKETALALPLICLIYLKIYPAPVKFTRQTFKLLGLGWLAVIIGWGLIRTWAFGSEQAVMGPGLIGFLKNIPSFLVYFSKLIYPRCLSPVSVFQDTWLLPGFGLLLGLAIWTFAGKLWRLPLFWFGWAWLAVTLLPTFIPIEVRSQHHLILEHRFYLPFVGLLMILVSGLNKIENRRIITAITILSAGIIAGSMLTAFKHSDHFRDPVAFWDRAVWCSPNSAAASANRGNIAYRIERDLGKAKYFLETAISQYPQQAYVHGTLGAIAFDQGDYPEAASQAAMELEKNRTDEALFLLGAANERLGLIDKAVPLWLEAVYINPKRYEAHLALLQYYYAADDKVMAQYHAQILEKRGRIQIPAIINDWLRESE